uniref:Pentapeptide repeat-containing protein n=1 Tax=Pseudomonas sp. GLE121 TaxID=1329969 RepID=R4L3X3_9PSED|nr:pentapeptide repeat-containing protein [Pseudomonas sp. GLE121]AGL12835.1 pentapeptide repeat-containing protein [Pseudomonas sp. GLE121]
MSETDKAKADVFTDKPSREIFSKTFTSINQRQFDNDYIEQIGRKNKGAQVSTCTFRSTIFVGCYFNGVTFTSCDFTSAKFIDCNLKDAKFVHCKLNYVSFRRTIVDSSEILANLPREPNVRRDLLRNLRVDARELGNIEDESIYIRKEIEASDDFYMSAFKAREIWYRNKYSGIDRIVFFLSWVKSKFSGLIWGNGEKPIRVLYSCVFTIIIMAAILYTYGYSKGQFPESEGFYENFAMALKLSLSEFLGVPYMVNSFSLKVPFLVSAFAALARYIFIGLLVSVMFRSFSRR